MEKRLHLVKLGYCSYEGYWHEVTESRQFDGQIEKLTGLELQEYSAGSLAKGLEDALLSLFYRHPHSAVAVLSEALVGVLDNLVEESDEEIIPSLRSLNEVMASWLAEADKSAK